MPIQLRRIPSCGPAAMEGVTPHRRARQRLPQHCGQCEGTRHRHGSGQQGDQSRAGRGPAPPRHARRRPPLAWWGGGKHRWQPGHERVQAAPSPPCRRGAGGHHPGKQRRAGAGQRAADLVQATVGGLHPVRRVMQRAAQAFVKLILAPAHASDSSASPIASMARAVWLFTAPGLIPIADAASASDKSA